MHRFFGEQAAYNLFIDIGYWLMLVTNFLYFKSKKDAMSLFSKGLIYASSKIHKVVGNVVQFFLIGVETYLASYVVDMSAKYNGTFGQLVGTGGNYFGLLTCFPLFISAFSLILIINPLKEVDIMTMGLPVYLFFVKLACFFNGCCWGIPWEHGLYNYHYDHPGYQVPVQAIEAFFAALLLVILLIYRKKAKPGTIYPMYLTLYCGTRFFSEFLKDDYPDVLGPFKTYHILCVVGFVIGLILLIIMNKYGNRLSCFFEKQQEKIINKTDKLREEKKKKAAEDAAKHETEMKERLEKAKAARAKASIKYKK